MTHSALHLAVRDLLHRYGNGLQAFQISIWSTEHHPNRVSVLYNVHVTGVPRDFRSEDPRKLLAWLRVTLKASASAAEPLPLPALLAIGLPPRLRRVK